MAEGVEELTRDKTCKPGKPPPTGTVQRVVNLALEPLPGGTTHWTGRMLAKAAGVSLRSEGPGWESNPRHRRQLCDPQASEGPPMVGPASSLDVPLHPTSVEGFFAKLTRRRLKRGVFRSVVDLQVAINHFVTETNADPKPFVWTADPKRVLACQTWEASVTRALWLDLTERRNGVPCRLAETSKQLNMTAWPAPIIRQFQGELSAA
jgi:hypothetical protein